METLEDAIRIRTGLPPENSGIQKVFIAAFVSDLDKTLVDNGEITEEEYQKQLEEFLRNGRK
jgi:polyhydroxyalkanoate synthesis regulator phasin